MTERTTETAENVGTNNPVEANDPDQLTVTFSRKEFLRVLKQNQYAQGMVIGQLLADGVPLTSDPGYVGIWLMWMRSWDQMLEPLTRMVQITPEEFEVGATLMRSAIYSWKEEEELNEETVANTGNEQEKGDADAALTTKG